MTTKPMPPQYNNLMPEIREGAQSASVFHSIQPIEVTISTDPKDREIYPQGYDPQAGGQLYALTGSAIAKLATKAGINRIAGEDHRTDDGSHPHIVSWHWAGEWVQPDGTTLRLAGDYTLDLRDWIETASGRVRGPRFEEAYNKNLIDAALKDMGLKKIAVPAKGKYATRAEKEDAARQHLLSLPDAERERMERLAELQALSTISAMRVHIHSRAQTGAMLRAIRKLLTLKAQYSLEELQRPFLVYRSRFDFTEMRKMIGDAQLQRLAIAAAGETLGISEGRLRALMEPKTEEVGETAAPVHGEVFDSYETPAAEPPPQVASLPWRNVTEPVRDSDHINPQLDISLIERARALITPGKHLANHMRKHYDMAKWSDLTYAQALRLWDYLDGLEIPPEFRVAHGFDDPPTPNQIAFWRHMRNAQDPHALAEVIDAETWRRLDGFLVEFAEQIANGDTTAAAAIASIRGAQ